MLGKSKTIRPSEFIRRPSAICSVMDSSEMSGIPANLQRRDSVDSDESGESVLSHIDATNLIDNEMAKTFAAVPSMNMKSLHMQGGQQAKRSYFGSRFLTSLVLRNSQVPHAEHRFSTAAGQPGSSAKTRHSHVGVDLAKIIFGESNAKALSPQHQKLPSVVSQIFGSQRSDKPGGSLGSRSLSALVAGDSFDELSEMMQRFLFLRHACGRFMANMKSQAFFIVLTLWALYGPDMVQWHGRSDDDHLFLIINTFVFGFFIVEIVLNAIGVRGWVFSVPACLDVVAVLSFLSDTLVLQTDTMNKDAERTTRLARSSRMTRLVRVARVARITKLVPRLIEFMGGHSNDLAKHVLLRRLYRLFLFLDTERRGWLTSFDLKVIYLVIMQECPFLLGGARKADILRKDIPSFTGDSRLKDPDHSLNFSEFARMLQSLSLGKQLLNFHSQEVERDDGVYNLTRKVSDKTALKICIGILIIFMTMTLLDTATPNESHVQGFGALDFTAVNEHRHFASADLAFICEQIRLFMEDHIVMLLHIANRTFVSDPGSECSAGISRSELDPFTRIDEILDKSKRRTSEALLICWPDESLCDPSRVRSVVLLDTVQEFRDQAMWSVIQTSTILVLIIIFILLFNKGLSRFSKSLLKPLRSLVDDMHAMCSLDLVEIDADEMDANAPKVEVAKEMLNLQRSFGSMRTAVRSWTKFVPPAIVSRLMTSGFEATIGVSRVEASILFVDIDGFEDVCGGLSPSETLDVLSSVLGKVAEAIQTNKGILLEFIGDEVLSAFNIPTVINHHTYYATNCAIAIHEAVEKMPSMVMQDGRSIAVRCRCGVHTAQILAGNVGSKKRMKFGLLGDGVNLTARLKTLNSRYRTQTIVSAQVIDADLIDERFVWRPLEKVAVKGKKEATTVYEVLGLKKAEGTEEFARLAGLHLEAFNLYHHREFLEAAKLCEEVHSLFEVTGRLDEPSRQLLKKCTHCIAQPPPPDWDGVERLQKKTFEVPVVSEDANEPVTEAGKDAGAGSPEAVDASGVILGQGRDQEVAREASISSLVMPDTNHSIQPRLDSRPLSLSQPLQPVARSCDEMDVPSCWRHMLEELHNEPTCSHLLEAHPTPCPTPPQGSALECCGHTLMRGSAGPRVATPKALPSSSFCGCRTSYAAPAIVLLPVGDQAIPHDDQVMSQPEHQSVPGEHQCIHEELRELAIL